MKLLQKISVDLRLDEAYIVNLVNKADICYKNYRIKKKDGGWREISQASPELKTLQYWVKKHILSKIPISKAAFAYQKGSSIKKHAQHHMGARHFFHADVHKFFPSISSAHLISILIKHQDIFSSMDLDVNEAAPVIAQICFRSNILCLGTVSSPMISNIIMYDFDNEMEKYCKSNHFKYSRYSDDIYISSQSYIDKAVYSKTKEELKKIGFELNREKTRFISTKNRMSVTGLILQQDAISIGASKKKAIKKMIYKKLVHNNGDGSEIMGYLSFLEDIEPQTYNKYIIKYTNYSSSDIVDALKS